MKKFKPAVAAEILLQVALVWSILSQAFYAILLQIFQYSGVLFLGGTDIIESAGDQVNDAAVNKYSDFISDNVDSLSTRSAWFALISICLIIVLVAIRKHTPSKSGYRPYILSATFVILLLGFVIFSQTIARQIIVNNATVSTL